MDLMAETLELCIVRRDCHSGLYSIQMPTRHEVQRLWTSLKIRPQVPDYDDPMWTELYQRLLAILPVRQKIAAELSSYGKPKENIMNAPNSQQHSTKKAQSFNTRHAQIRDMTGSQALAECQRLNIRVEPHPTNPGITAMRAKNTLFTRARANHPPLVEDAA